MISDDETSKKNEKIITESLLSSQVEPPELISRRIRKAAIDNLESQTKLTTHQNRFNSSWYKLFPIAACMVLSFYVGTTFQDVSVLSENDTALVFQGSNDLNLNEKAKDWSQDDLLKAIVESVLAGDITRAEQLIKIYKKRYPKDSQ